MMDTITLPRPKRKKETVEPLRADDFRRLGLALSESRVAVIRQAARQISSSVVTRGSGQDDVAGDAEEELARVLASAYRLLDPRRRDELVQRVQLVRAEPTPVRTWLWGETSGVSVAEEDARQADDEQRDDDWMLAMLADLRTEPLKPPVVATTRGAQGRLLQGRLLQGRRTLPTRVLDWVSRIGIGWVLGGVLLMATFLGTLLVASQRGPRAAAVESEPGPVGPAVAEVTEPEVELNAAGLSNPLPGDVDSESVGELENLEPVANVSDSGATDDSRDPSPLELPLPDVTPSIEPPTVVVDGPGVMESVEESPVDIVADLSGDKVAGPEQPIEVSPEPPQVPLDQAIRHPYPAPDAIAAADQRLRDLLVPAGPAVGVGGALAADLWKRHEQEPAGSVDHLVLALGAAEQNVLVGRLDAAWEIVSTLAKQYETTPLEIAAEVLYRGSIRAVALTERERMCEWALRASDRGMLEERYAIAAEVARVGTQVAAETRDSDLRDRFKQRRDAITTAERMSEQAQKLVSSQTVAASVPKDASIVGRHLVINLRRWEEGMPWLAEAAFPRVSKCARDELAFKDRSSVDGLVTLAHGWIEAADVQKASRIPDSMYQRARELLLLAIDKSSGLRRLEIQQELRELEKRMPADLLPLDAEEGERWMLENGINPPANADLPVAGGQPNGALDDPLTRGALGQLFVGGQPTRIGLQFQSHVPLPRSAIDQALDLAAIPPGAVQMEAHGFLAIQQPTTIRIQIRGPALESLDLSATAMLPATGMRLAINGQVPTWQPLQPGDDARTAVLDLPVGVHRVVWQVSGDQFPPLQLIFLDDRAKRLLHIHHDDTTRQAAQRTPVSQWVVVRPR